MTLEIDGLSSEDVRNALNRNNPRAAARVAQHLPVTQVLEVFAVDDVVMEMRNRWEDSGFDDEPANPDWERIAREASVATVQAVIAALHYLDEQSTLPNPLALDAAASALGLHGDSAVTK